MLAGQEGRVGFLAWGTSGSAEQLFGVFFWPWQDLRALVRGSIEVFTAPITEIRFTGLGFRIWQDFGISEHFICHFNKIQNFLWFECAVKWVGSWTVSPLCHIFEEVRSSMWSLVWGQKLFLALVVPCAGPKLLVWLLRRCWQTDKSRWGGKLWKMLYPSWKAAVSVHFWEPPVAGPSVLSLLATFQVTKPGRSRWPRCCGCALPCLPRNATARNPTFLPAYLWSTFLNSLSTLGVFPDGCLYFFFVSSIFAGLMTAAMS